MRASSAYVALSFLLAACAAKDDGGGTEVDPVTLATPAQMNDLSILFPLAKTKTELEKGYVQASDAGARGTLLPLDLIKDNDFVWPDDHQPVLAGGQLNPLRYPFLRVVSIRLDPCAAHIGTITDRSTCKAQMRLVLEDVTMAANGQGTLAHDASLHAGYSLTAAEFDSALAEVVALRTKNAPNRDLGALAPHPVMVEQGLGGAMADGVRKIILKYAGKNNLARVTRFALNGYDTPFHPKDWIFTGFNFENGKRNNISISALPAGTMFETLIPPPKAMLGADTFPAFDPAPNVDDITNLRDLGVAQAASADERQKAFDSTLRIDNPNVHSFDTIDCASCHAAQPFRSVVGEKGLSMTSTALRFDPASFVDAAAAKNVFTPSDLTNFHAFSYRDADVGISQRVINETASIVAYVNGR